MRSLSIVGIVGIASLVSLVHAFEPPHQPRDERHHDPNRVTVADVHTLEHWTIANGLEAAPAQLVYVQDALLAALASPDPRVRAAAVDALYRTKPHLVAPAHVIPGQEEAIWRDRARVLLPKTAQLLLAVETIARDAQETDRELLESARFAFKHLAEDLHRTAVMDTWGASNHELVAQTARNIRATVQALRDAAVEARIEAEVERRIRERMAQAERVTDAGKARKEGQRTRRKPRGR